MYLCGRNYGDEILDSNLIESFVSIGKWRRTPLCVCVVELMELSSIQVAIKELMLMCDVVVVNWNTKGDNGLIKQ